MDSRAQGLHTCADRLCSFFAALASELEMHEEREAKIDESGEQRVRRRRGVCLWEILHRMPVLSRVRFSPLALAINTCAFPFAPCDGSAIHSREQPVLARSPTALSKRHVGSKARLEALFIRDDVSLRSPLVGWFLARSSKMFEHKEDFRLADEDREDAIRASTARIRMAADEEELDASFARVMDLLDQVPRWG